MKTSDVIAFLDKASIQAAKTKLQLDLLKIALGIDIGYIVSNHFINKLIAQAQKEKDIFFMTGDWRECSRIEYEITGLRNQLRGIIAPWMYNALREHYFNKVNSEMEMLCNEFEGFI